MLTNNAKTLLRLWRNNNPELIPGISTPNNSAPAYYEVKDTTGNIRYVTVNPKNANATAFITSDLSNTNAAPYGIAIGADGHEESEDDYTLGSQITTLTATITKTQYQDSENNKNTMRLDLVVSNNTSEDVTVREIGIFAQYNTMPTQGATVAPGSAVNPRSIMMDRTVLEQPITIPVGEARIIRYEFAY